MDRLYQILLDKRYYSLEINYTSSMTSIPVEYLLQLDKYRIVDGDWINIFQYNDVTYIGLQSRYLAYERDRLLGANWVEDAIKRGEYG